MLSGALALSRADAVLVPGHIIGDIAFCEPDYRQMLLWAKALRMEPEAVLERLLDDGTLFGLKGPWYDRELSLTVIRNARIIQLQWDIGRLPLTDFEWVDGIVIESVIFSVPEYRDQVERRMSLPLPKLRRLECGRLGIRHLDLSRVPHLVELDCTGNNLGRLDLSEIPELRILKCADIQIDELDLSTVADLTELDCSYNHLSTIDLPAVDQLTRLNCFHNRLTELDLSTVPELTELTCDENQIVELDLSGVPHLTWLMCANNQIATLNLSPVPLVAQVYCRGNPLMELDICPLENLEVLDFDDENTKLIKRLDQNF